MKKIVFSVVMVLLGFSPQLLQAAKLESFNSAASAAANGWTAVGNGVDGQAAGWIETSSAGGAAGEAQFDVLRGGLVSYADGNLGLTVNGTGGFSMSGKLNLVGLVNTPDLGNPPVLGFFSSATQFVGITFRGDFDDLGSDLAWGLRFSTTGDGLRINDGGDASRKIGIGVPRTFSLNYDPMIGAFGTITAEISGAGAPITHALSEGNRDLLNGVSFNLAGLIKSATGANANGINLRLDDLEYTGVPAIPEPTTIIMALILVVAAGARRSVK